jgi:rhamnosyl/mannosyltransferase
MPLWLRRLRPDIVHLHFPNPMGDLTFLLSGWRGRLVVTYHADIIKQRRLLPLYQPVLNRLFQRVDRIIATSGDYIASSATLSANKAKCTVIPLGIETAPLDLTDADGPAVCALKREHGDRIIAFVGVLRYYKGLDVLIRAMKDVRGRVLIAGRGEERDRLETLAREIGVADRVVLLGEIDDDRRRQLLHAADVLVLPSIDRCEAFGLSQLEAMACGTPVVSTNLPTGVRFVNRDGETGVIVPPGDQHALAGALTRLLDDEPLRTRLGEAAARRVRETFTAERMVESTRRVYDEVLETA